MYRVWTLWVLVMLLLFSPACGRVTPAVQGRFAYIDENGHAAVFDLAHSKQEWVDSETRKCTRPAWSPDGQTIAFLATEPMSGKQSIILLNLTQGTMKSYTIQDSIQPLDPTMVYGSLVWSATGRYVTLQTGGQPSHVVLVIEAATGKESLRTGAVAALWSSEGDTIALAPLTWAKEPNERSTDLVLVDIATGKQVVQARGEKGHWLIPMAWTPDKGLVYRDSTPYTSGPTYYYDLKGNRFDSFSPTRLTPPNGWKPSQATGQLCGDPAVDPKTGHILFAAQQESGIWIWLNPKGSQTFRKLVKGLEPVWQP